ncbi:MAG TPA: LysM peptidoglycan-binding domain-containing protein [Rectinemataceae bacterium]|nr:LysM peptidoglycan-binding domain-containing protein [Rectinemataceae bacterium]
MIDTKNGHPSILRMPMPWLFPLVLGVLMLCGSGQAYGFDPDSAPGSVVSIEIPLPEPSIEVAPVWETVEIPAALPAQVTPITATAVLTIPTQAPETLAPTPAAEPSPMQALVPAMATENIEAIAAPEPSQTSIENLNRADPDIILSAGILVDGLQYDIPMPWGQESFETLRASYLSSGGKKWLEAVMERSLPYLAYVEEKIEEYNLPRELVFLPVIESEYSPFAVSRSGATGIWQFMRNSISGYGLSISEWTDDRKDFMKSTDAALRKLQDNYKDLDDWLLAIAAYNTGLGAVSRAVKSSDGETIDFWHLYDSKKLSREPLSYVPKFLAIASILRYPELHGLPSEWGEKHSWETLATSRQVDLNVLSERTGISLDVLKKGNAELNYRITPPITTHMIKVPADMAQIAKAVLDDTSSPLFKYDIYKVKSGDTLGAIAQRFNTPLNIVLQANPGIKADTIRIGQTLIIPHLSGSSSVAGKGSTGESALASKYYSVKKGDTLSSISLLFNTKPTLLAERNGIGVSSVLKIGQKLKVPSP